MSPHSNKPWVVHNNKFMKPEKENFLAVLLRENISLGWSLLEVRTNNTMLQLTGIFVI